ncbi:alpha/beta fold hydrolase [Gluconacetobacter sacchari]|uniref:alpha/beta fold hydrolase n=1 Tax=Gluconacetobacter sacchari TaxID=92759 RepID=UPI0039B4E50F
MTESRFLYGANVHANGIRQHYLRYGGQGQTMVLIPGITSPAITWGFVAEELARTFDVYVLDVRGRGLSATGPDLDYDLDSYPPVSGPGRRAYPAKLDCYTESIRLARQGMTSEDMLRFCPSWTEEQRALRAEWLHTCDELATRITFEKFHTEDIHQDIPHLRTPATLVVATRGGVILPEDEAEILALNPSITVTHVPEAGHMIPWDNLEGFVVAVGA